MHQLGFVKVKRAGMGSLTPISALTTSNLLGEGHVMAALNHTDTLRCFKCGETKPLDAFWKSVRERTVSRARCKPCYSSRRSELKRARSEAKFLEPYVCPAGVIAPDTVILDDAGRDWAWAYVVFRPVPGFPRYLAGTDGSVWSRSMSRGWFPLVLRKDRDGYPRIRLRRDRKSHYTFVHKIILETFIGPCPAGMECCHRNGNRACNTIRNLRWDTRSANRNERVFDRVLVGVDRPNSKLVDADVIRIRAMVAGGTSVRSVAKKFGIAPSTATRIIRRERWKHVLCKY